MNGSILAIPIFFTVLMGISVGVWTYLDADSRNAVYAEIIAAIVAVFIPAILVYLFYRNRIGPRTTEIKLVQKVAGILGVGSIFTVLLAQSLTPLDPFSAAYSMLYLAPVGVVVGYLWIYQVSPRIFNTSS